MNSRVFLMETCKHDVSQCVIYGDIVQLIEPHSRRISIWDRDIEEVLSDALDRAKFNPAFDYMIAAGHLVLLMHMSAVLTAKYGGAQVLFFDAITRGYVPRLLGSNTNTAAGRGD